MIIQAIVDEGLGNSSYLIGSEETGLAAVIDPQRDVDRYERLAQGIGLNLTYALDTHLHADFISGARELAAHVDGLIIGASAEGRLDFEHLPLFEGDNISLGDINLRVVSTPGHTPEHVSYVISAARAKAPAAIFSGGALIVGGAARTDLLGHDLSEYLARRLYHTIHDRLMVLPDAVTVYPTHSSGSFCAAPTATQRTTTIGRERFANRLVLARTEDDFVALALEGLPSYPVYYREMRPINQRGPTLLGGLPQPPPLSVEAVQELMTRGSAVLDARQPAAFLKAHIPDSYGITLDAPLITWAGWLIPFGTPLVLLTEDTFHREQAIRQLVRIGYDDIQGYLEGGLDSWERAGLPLQHFATLSVDELHQRLGDGDAPTVLDVRQDAEWQAGHIPGAVHIENGRLPYDELTLLADEPIVVHCQHYDRSAAALSILSRRGYRNLKLMDGGFSRWEASGLEIER